MVTKNVRQWNLIPATQTQTNKFWGKAISDIRRKNVPSRTDTAERTHSPTPISAIAMSNSCTHHGLRHYGRKTTSKQSDSFEYWAISMTVPGMHVWVLVCVPPKQKTNKQKKALLTHEKEMQRTETILGTSWQTWNPQSIVLLLHSRSLDNGQELHDKPPFCPVWPVHPQRQASCMFPPTIYCIWPHGQLFFLGGFWIHIWINTVRLGKSSQNIYPDQRVMNRVRPSKQPHKIVYSIGIG